MKRILLAGAVLLAFPVVALGKPATPQHRRSYEHLYHQVARQFGARTPGRNIVRWGVKSGGAASDTQVLASIAVLERMLVPPMTQTPQLAPPTTTASTTASAAPTSSGGQYAIPSYIVRCESGGNYSAVNPSSGAGGAYQIIPSTWAAYGGTGLPQNASPAEQDRIAAKIYAAQGAAPWSCG